jgi:hypothetical protein
MKTCNKCKETKDESEFYFKDKNKTRIQGECKICQKNTLKKHYINNKKTYIDKARQNIKTKIENFEKYKSTLKCEKCGENHPAVLDFHHLDPSKKEFQIGNGTKKGIEKMLKEIEKCIILCSNCHRKLHWEERRLST